jgi:uncharacterized protein YbaR (Trm112 family)
MTVTQEQLDELGRRHHRGNVIACPLCHSRLRGDERAYAPRISVPVRFYCPLHGVLGDSDPPDLRIAWPEEQVRRMFSEHLARGEGRCPIDQAKVGVTYIGQENGAYLCITCPSCGRVREGPWDLPE